MVYWLQYFLRKNVRMIIFDGIRDLDLGETLSCGQSFRWRRGETGHFHGVVRGRSVTVVMDGGRLTIDGAGETDRAMWEDYFDRGGTLCTRHPHPAAGTF